MPNNKFFKKSITKLKKQLKGLKKFITALIHVTHGVWVHNELPSEFSTTCRFLLNWINMHVTTEVDQVRS